MAHNPAYSATIKNTAPGQGEVKVRVYKLKRETGLYADYDDPKITYRAEEIIIGKVIDDKDL